MSTRQSFEFLNPEFGLVLKGGFREVRCGGDSTSTPSPSGDPGRRTGPSFTSDDPRLFDPRRNIRTTLDRPPLVVDDNIYSDRKRDDFGGIRAGYREINGGQYLYYVDGAVKDPYFAPNYLIRSTVDYIDWWDPMGAYKPQYPRTPTTTSYGYLSGLSSLRDSMAHREDIMALQSAKYNSQRSTPLL